MKTRRRFSEEFRSEAVRLLETSGRLRSEIARELGIDETVLKRWQQRVNGELRAPGELVPRQVEDEEVKRLRRENARLKMEVEILKKATAFFARGTL